MNKLSTVVFKAYEAICLKAASEVLLAVVAVGLGLAVCSPLLWSQEGSASDRKVITRVEPAYPATLERLYIGGVVRLEVVVSASGTVQSAKLIGGNPILGQSAISAVKQWKFAPGKAETTNVVRLEFDPHR